MLCQQYSSNGTYCVPEVLGSVQVSLLLHFFQGAPILTIEQNSTNNQLTISTLVQVLSGNGLTSLVASAAPGDVCTDCGKALLAFSLLAFVPRSLIDICRVIKGEALAQAAAPSSSASANIRSGAVSKCGSQYRFVPFLPFALTMNFPRYNRLLFRQHHPIFSARSKRCS